MENRRYSLATRKFAAGAMMACMGTIAMVLFPYELVIYMVGLTTMAIILGILLFYKDKGHWEVVYPLPSDMFSEKERIKLGRNKVYKEWVYE